MQSCVVDSSVFLVTREESYYDYILALVWGRHQMCIQNRQIRQLGWSQSLHSEINVTMSGNLI